MSNEFYDYIAKHVIKFFLDNKNEIRPGERYSLRLDNEEMVAGVNAALERCAEKEKIRGNYSYKNPGEETSVYDTFTFHIQDKKDIVVASKTADMQDDFLATLRNAQLTDDCFPILMITYSPIDTIISGTGDLAAAGMPFHADSLFSEIKTDIENENLSTAETELLKFELARKRADKFADHSSLYEYNVLLGVLGKGKVDDHDYIDMRLLPSKTLPTLKESRKITRLLRDNQALFEEIDRIYRTSDDIEAKLEKDYDRKLIRELKDKKKQKKNWYDDGLTYEAVLASKERRKKQDENPLQINEDEMVVYSGSLLECTFFMGEDFFVCTDGTSKSEQRKKNILVYNPLEKNTITFEIPTLSDIKASRIQKKESDGITVSLEKRAVVIDMTIDPSGCTFARVELEDTSTNGVKYVLKFCVVNLKHELLEEIDQSYILDVPKKVTNARLQLQSIKDLIVLNHQNEGNQIDICTVEEGGEYELTFDKGLQLNFNDDVFNPDTDSVEFTLKAGYIAIPIEVLNREKKKSELTGVGVFKKKYESDKRLTYLRHNQEISCSTMLYAIKEPYRSKLSYEYQIISNGWLAAEFGENRQINERVVNVPEKVIDTYSELVQLIKRRKQVPSLVRYDKEYRALAHAYIASIEDAFAAIQQDSSLSDDSNNLLDIGCLFDATNKTIYMTPLHPLNVRYQLSLSEEENVYGVRDDLIHKLSARYLLPYIYSPYGKLYEAIEDNTAPEWRTYKELKNKKNRGSRQFVKRLVSDKIREYKKHFDFLFDGMHNSIFRINLINMGDCTEVLIGIVMYYQTQNRENELYDDFEIHIYGEGQNDNQFTKIGDNAKLRRFLQDKKLTVDINEMIDVLTSHVKCFFRNDADDAYAYAHLTFYEMSTDLKESYSKIDTISTGIALGGLTSGLPSILDQGYYKTGYGTRYADDNDLIRFATEYNAVSNAAYHSAPYRPGYGVVTTIPKDNKAQLDKIYDASNWVVFVDPKVDLSYFEEASNDSNLMIIHYSDQLSSSSSYDDITVTNKSAQYADIIHEQLQKKGLSVEKHNIHSIINLFNAINGSWLLHLITAKKLSGAADSNFSREKMSILSAIKLMLAEYDHGNIVWIPISLEEVLRVSRGTGLSQKSGILSAKNLGFETNAPTCDDILMIGIEGPVDNIKVYIHPVEVKIGENANTYIGKAIEQVTNTHNELVKALWPDEGKGALSYKLTRNFIIQLAIASAAKMKLYGVHPTANWDLILDNYRQALLNDRFEISDLLDQYMGIGSVVSFRTDTHAEEVKEENGIYIFDLPENKGSEYMIKDIDIIRNELQKTESVRGSMLSMRYHPQIVYVPVNTDDTKTLDTTDLPKDKGSFIADNENTPAVADTPGTMNDHSAEDSEGPEPDQPAVEPYNGMQVVFGRNQVNGNNIVWAPNNTDELFHPNTGIIGTMGTGKTQFTKSMVAQLYREQSHNIDGKPLGILIFDYKGDYNKEEFVNAVNAKVYEPYHLPFNPFALIKGATPKPLLPMHTANAFQDTLAKVYPSLGPKQKNTLLNCILDAYEVHGIKKNDRTTWDRSAPTFRDIYAVYDGNEDIKKNDSLASVLFKLDSFEIFESDPAKTESLYDLLNGVIVIELNGYDADIQSLVVAITLDLFYSQMQTNGSSKLDGAFRQLTKFILVDEADNFMSQDFPALKKIMKEGREFGVGIILSTQSLTHFGSGEDDYSKYILTWIVHNVKDLKTSDVGFVFGTEKGSETEARLFNDIKQLAKHHSIAKIGNVSTPQYIEDLPFWKLMQDT